MQTDCTVMKILEDFKRGGVWGVGWGVGVGGHTD